MERIIVISILRGSIERQLCTDVMAIEALNLNHRDSQGRRNEAVVLEWTFPAVVQRREGFFGDLARSFLFKLAVFSAVYRYQTLFLMLNADERQNATRCMSTMGNRYRHLKRMNGIRLHQCSAVSYVYRFKHGETPPA